MRCRVFIEKRIKKDFSLVENLKEIFLLLLSNVCIHEKPRGWDALRKWSVDEIKNNFHAWFNRSSREISICVALNDFFFILSCLYIKSLWKDENMLRMWREKVGGWEKKGLFAFLSESVWRKFFMLHNFFISISNKFTRGSLNSNFNFITLPNNNCWYFWCLNWMWTLLSLQGIIKQCF